MTPPEKPDTAGTEPERTSVITTTDKDGSTEKQSPEPEAPEAGAVQANETTPPPWQRVTPEGEVDGDQQVPPGFPTEETDPDVTQALPANRVASVPVFEPGDDATIAVDRSVVAGAAANRLFGLEPPTASAAPPRAAVNLDNTGRPGGTPPSSAPPSALRRPGRGPRRANLQIKRFDPWSVLKLSLVLGVALFFVWLVAVGALYAVLDGMGVWDKVNGLSSELLNGNEGGSGGPLISAGRVFGIAAIIGAINIVLFSALATVGAFVYNVSADLAGGLEVTLAERE